MLRQKFKSIHQQITIFLWYDIFMRIIVFIIITFSLAIGLGSSHLTAAPINEESQVANLQISRWYKVYWLGMHVGDLMSEIKETKPGVYAIESRLHSRGIAKRFTKFWSIAKSHSVLSNKGDLLPSNFTNRSNLRKKKRQISINYQHEGRIASEQVTPPDNRKKRPAVATEKKLGAVDPHTAILLAHKKIRQALVTGKNVFTIPLYDARRLSHLHFTVHGRKIIEHQDNDTKVIHVSVKRDLIAGYTNNEHKRLKKENPVIDIYLEDNATMMPIQALATAPIGSANVVLERECYSLDSCRSTPKDYAYLHAVTW